MENMVLLKLFFLGQTILNLAIHLLLILGLLNHVTCTCMNLRAICKLTLITDLGDFPFHSVFCGNKQPENRNCNFVVPFAVQWMFPNSLISC